MPPGPQTNAVQTQTRELFPNPPPPPLLCELFFIKHLPVQLSPFIPLSTATLGHRSQGVKRNAVRRDASPVVALQRDLCIYKYGSNLDPSLLLSFILRKIYQSLLFWVVHTSLVKSSDSSIPSFDDDWSTSCTYVAVATYEAM